MPIKADKSLRAYYNEIDPYAAQWIRNLMAEGWITKGDVDVRSIEDVRPDDIAGYDRLHFFAGIAVWDYALNQAGWGRSEVWTGSCPCQPFSSAGAGAGCADERHLWPAMFHLIEQCKPATVLGEQVASKDAEPWLDLVQADLETLGYAVGAIPFPAAGIGAPNIRERLYWVADSDSIRIRGKRPGSASTASRGVQETNRERERVWFDPWASCSVMVPCADGKRRPIEPGAFPVAHGDSARVGRLRAYGNAINAKAAQVFIESVMDSMP